MRKIILIVLFAFLYLQIQAQDPVAVFNRHRDSIPSEQIYLHFNKQAYVAGEIIWFKAYTYAAGMIQPVSTNLFAELLNESGEIIQSRKLAVLNGLAVSGQFILPLNAPQGIYFVRSWTNYTRNLDQSYVFKKGIPVFNPANAASSTIQNNPGYSFEWFPEGGKLASGVDNVIGFRCFDKQLQPVKVNGNLLDSKGASLGTFSTNKFGLGYFSITPAKGEKYFGEVQLPDNSKQKFELPAALDNVVVLSVVDHELGKIFTIFTPPGKTDNPKEVTLLAVMNNNIVLNTKIVIKDFSGNKAEAAFTVRTDLTLRELAYLPKPDYALDLTRAKGLVFRRPKFEVFIPEGAVYSDGFFTYNEVSNSDYASDMMQIGDVYEPIQSSITVNIKPNRNLSDSVKAKAIIQLTNYYGETSSCGGEWNGEFLSAQCRSFGNFAIAIDTIPPVLEKYYIPSDMENLYGGSIKYVVKDNMTGIKSYSGKIDGVWYLFDYDKKNDMFTANVDPFMGNSDHSVEITVTDGKGNTTVWKSTFYY